MLTATLCFASSFSFSIHHLPKIPSLSASELERFEATAQQRIRKAYQLVQANPEHGEANGQLGMVLHALGLHERAATCFQRAHLLQPESFRWAYYLGVAQSESGRQTDAFATLRGAIRLKPDYLPARLKLAKILLAAGKFQESGEIYEKLVQQKPESALAHYGLGRVQSARGESGAAIESYRRACRLSPGFGPAHYALAVAYRNQGERAKSEEQFSLFKQRKEGRLKMEDPFLEALVTEEQVHFNKGRELLQAGRLQEAVVEYERALETEPDLWGTHSSLGFARMALGQLDKAEKHYRAALQVSPERWESHSNLGSLLRKKGRHREAIDAFHRALEINPFSADAHSSLAEVMAAERRWDEAVRHSRLALENNPHHRLAHFHLGRSLLTQGKSREAIPHLLKTLTVEDERTPALMYNLAEAYARTGNRQKGAYYLRQARKRATSFGQTKLVADIDKILRQIGQAGDPQ